MESRFKKSFKKYCECTSIHGVQYLGEQGLPLKERACWIFTLSITFLINAYLIGNELLKWKNSQVIISNNHTFTPNWEIPFPVVTICSENKYNNNLSSIFTKSRREVDSDRDLQHHEKI
uniref:Uncharacterized protein n=1 Tax=Clastoptera arizonana TaxID=38151 RepID=A0A1B6C6T5_9HEMI